MPTRLPQGTRGDLYRKARACEALPLILLAEDHRVQRVYAEWLATPDPSLLSACVDDLGIAHYQWLPALLGQMFAAATAGAAGAPMDPARPIEVDPDLSGLRPLVEQTGRAQRLPKNGGENVFRDVMWFYRNRIKVPPDSTHAMANEWLYAGKHGELEKHKIVRSGIETAIKRVTIWFSTLEASAGNH